MSNTRCFYTIQCSPWGFLGIVSEQNKLVRIDIRPHLNTLNECLLYRYPGVVWSDALQPIAKQLIDKMNAPSLKIKVNYQLKGTDFQLQVWDSIAQIPVGKTKSYQDIAIEIGRPKAMRAVGTACGANPLPFIIPCHRVVGSHGRLGGFGLGLPLKKELLRKEGIKGLF